MAPRVLVPLAEGFEEIEAVTVIDVLRRAEVEVVVAGLEPGPVTGSRGIVLTPDVTLSEVHEQSHDAVVLPGGGPGSAALAADARVTALLRRAVDDGRLVAAICAAPAVVLAPLGLLEGRRATCYPGLADRLPNFVAEPVVQDGALLTSQGPGTAMAFALALVERLVDADTAAAVGRAALA